jgi:DNA-binding protein H-NS
MAIDRLWDLHEKVTTELRDRIIAEKRRLEDRLRQLNQLTAVKQPSGTMQRRQYPPVPPKFQNPEDPSETWAGRGKLPRWLNAQLKSGKRIEDFRVGF